ncbi:hypothetical protein TYRP_012866, partial [Tyrophagus putrescentiae]
SLASTSTSISVTAVSKYDVTPKNEVAAVAVAAAAAAAVISSTAATGAPANLTFFVYHRAIMAYILKTPLIGNQNNWRKSSRPPPLMVRWYYPAASERTATTTTTTSNLELHSIGGDVISIDGDG